jgi:hypothetical protein
VFVDWQKILSRLQLPQMAQFDFKQLPKPTVLGIALVLVILVTALWIDKGILRPIYQILNFQTVWYLAIPISLAMLLKSSFDILKQFVVSIRRPSA